ncbi:MAG: hypothetical protein WC166_08630, partial [Bacteroidales bacterium]
MILFFQCTDKTIIAVGSNRDFSEQDISALSWLFNAPLSHQQSFDDCFVGPRREMITPWSTTATEITYNMNIRGIYRIEEYFPVESENAVY